MAAPEAEGRTKAPKTPLRRVPANVLRVQALSGSRQSRPPALAPPADPQAGPADPSRPPTQPLESVAPLFLDLADAFSDLHTNLSHLERVAENLNGFNHAFSSYLYGLRMGTYTTEFGEAPQLESFQAARDRRRSAQQLAQRMSQEQQHASLAEAPDRSQELSTLEGPDNSIASASSHLPRNPRPTASSSSKLHQPPSGASKNFSGASRAQQRQLMRATEPIMATLPIKFREQQPSRQEMERVICLLLLYPTGLALKQIVKLEPSIALHRARECCTALVAAKQGSKFNRDVSRLVFSFSPTPPAPHIADHVGEQQGLVYRLN